MKRQFLVSTDCTGIFGSVEEWKYVWESTLKNPSCKGFEMIGWRWSGQLLRAAHKKRLPVIGIHGRTGGWREDKALRGRLIMATLNELFLTNRALLQCGQQTEYILLHRSCMTPQMIRFFIDRRDSIKTLFIENVVSAHELAHALTVIEQLKQGEVSVGLTFDLVHFLRDPHIKEHPSQSFDLMLRTLESFKNLTVPLNLHLPIGTYENDSLPIYTFTKQMWNELSHAVQIANPHYVVLENQQKRAYSFYLPRQARDEVRKRNEAVVEMLQDWHIIG